MRTNRQNDVEILIDPSQGWGSARTLFYIVLCKKHKLKLVFNKLDTEWFGNNGLCQHGNKPPGSVKLMNILTGCLNPFK
jgi:hypothetical protein